MSSWIFSAWQWTINSVMSNAEKDAHDSWQVISKSKSKSKSKIKIKIKIKIKKSKRNKSKKYKRNNNKPKKLQILPSIPEGDEN